MTRPHLEAEAILGDMEQLLRTQCSIHSIDFGWLKDTLQLKWRASEDIDGYPTLPPVGSSEPVTVATFAMHLETLLFERCTNAGFDYTTFRRGYVTTYNASEIEDWWLEEFGLTQPGEALSHLIAESRSLISRYCTDYSIDIRDFWLVFFAGLNNQLQQKSTPDVRGKILLEQAFACKKRDDLEGHQKACTEWLYRVHGVRIGDTVRIVEGQTDRVGVLGNVEIEVDEFRLADSTVKLIGSFGGEKSEEHYQEAWMQVQKGAPAMPIFLQRGCDVQGN